MFYDAREDLWNEFVPAGSAHGHQPPGVRVRNVSSVMSDLEGCLCIFRISIKICCQEMDSVV